MNVWLKGLLSTVVSSLGAGMVLGIEDSKTFNFSLVGWQHFGEVTILLILVHAGGYLQNSPLYSNPPKTNS